MSYARGGPSGEFIFGVMPYTVLYPCLLRSTRCVYIYIAYLSTRLSYVSITNYLSALWYLHKINRYSHVEPSSFALRQTLLGT